MKRTLGWLLLAVVLFAVSGCGGGHDEPAFVETSIISDADVDGDIVDVNGVRTVTLVGRDAVPGVLAGIDPVSGDEYRAFLDFPLTSVPLNAQIQSAILTIRIRSVTVLPTTATVPIRIELVSFEPPLLASDFDRSLLLPLASTTIVPPISSGDVNNDVDINVTQLMVEAQLRGLPDFQVRILEDLGFTVPGLVEIDETSDTVAPLLRVVYF